MIANYSKEFKEIFGFYEPKTVCTLSLQMGMLAIDILAFHKAVERYREIHDLLPSSVRDNESIKDFVLQHYGHRGVNFVNKWIGGEYVGDSLALKLRGQGSE